MDTNQYLQHMGIDVWIPRPESALTALACQVATCVRCPLHQSRTQTVFSRGNPDARLMIVGEAPGFHEDKQGLPFVGKAGQLLNEMLRSVGLSENDVYIANVLKCRPPENRQPQPDEIAACSDYLSAQIAHVAPKLLLALGRFSAQALTKNTRPLRELRAKMHHYQNIPCLVSYHPAYLLRSPLDKKQAYTDWVKVREHLDA